MDGEIGLADKAELERLMGADPELRREYKQLRRIGLLLGSAPEVSVHPERFRRRVLEALEARSRPYFTPQRAFAAAMLVVLLVIGMTFGMLLYQTKMLGEPSRVSAPMLSEATPDLAPGLTLLLTVHTTPEAFFNRLLVETQLNMTDQTLLNVFMQQTRVFEGAVCDPRGGLNIARFPDQLPSALRLQASPQQALKLESIGDELTDRGAELRAVGRGGTEMRMEEFLLLNSASSPVAVFVNFDS